MNINKVRTLQQIKPLGGGKYLQLQVYAVLRGSLGNKLPHCSAKPFCNVIASNISSKAQLDFSQIQKDKTFNDVIFLLLPQVHLLDLLKIKGNHFFFLQAEHWKRYLASQVLILHFFYFHGQSLQAVSICHFLFKTCLV